MIFEVPLPLPKPYISVMKCLSRPMSSSLRCVLIGWAGKPRGEIGKVCCLLLVFWARMFKFFNRFLGPHFCAFCTLSLNVDIFGWPLMPFERRDQRRQRDRGTAFNTNNIFLLTDIEFLVLLNNRLYFKDVTCKRIWILGEKQKSYDQNCAVGNGTARRHRKMYPFLSFCFLSPLSWLSQNSYFSVR